MALRFYFLGLLIFLSCSVPNLLLERKPYHGASLRLDGYYYKYSYGYADGVIVKVYFFYNNGVVLDGISTSLSDLTEKEERYISGEYYNWIKDKRFYWGVHKIDGRKIQFEQWTYFNSPRERLFRSGIILNDTTFVITKVLMRGDISYPHMAADTFHFKQFSPKPDSVNTFIPID